MFTYIEWNPKNPVRANFIFLPCIAPPTGIDSQASSMERLIWPDVTRRNMRMTELFDVNGRWHCCVIIIWRCIVILYQNNGQNGGVFSIPSWSRSGLYEVDV